MKVIIGGFVPAAMSRPIQPARWLTILTASVLPIGAGALAATPGFGPSTPACAGDPIEPVWTDNVANLTRVKSPAQEMHFTAGLPFRFLADAEDINAWQCPPGHPPYVCNGTEERFYIDGQLVGAVPPSTTDFSLWELRLAGGLAAGDHVLTVSYVPYVPSTGGAGEPISGLVPVTIHVDPMPLHGHTVTLSKDLVLSGSTNLDWEDTTVIGNGHRIITSDGYSGSVTIRNAFITGLGTYDDRGLTVSTTAAVAIEKSIFEATGALAIQTWGGASVTIRNNEFRANNLIRYVSDDPSVPVILQLSGNSSGAKVFQGNRVGGGIVSISGGNGWQIGGLSAGQGNVLVGPRAVVELTDSSGDRIQGNYLHHDYRGGWSQGFNLWLQGHSGGELAEHNVIRGGSWPVQNFGGEFRYNLVVDSGHTFWRGSVDGTRIHHNIFTNASGPNTAYDGVIQVYEGESGLSIFNNTFDGGGQTGLFDAPVLNIGPGSLFQSVRNNLMIGFDTVDTGAGHALVSADTTSVSSSRITSADYNGWYNPLAQGTPRYLPGLVKGAPGSHDIQSDPLLTHPAPLPYPVQEGCIWLGKESSAKVLSVYWRTYQPLPASPLINAGDPADGPGSYIGAVGPKSAMGVPDAGRESR